MSRATLAPIRPDLDLAQWFTSPELAAKLVRWARLPPAPKVIDPAAGDGALLTAVLAQHPDAHVLGVEADPSLHNSLAGAIGGAGHAVPACFFDYVAEKRCGILQFDAAIMNPPTKGVLGTDREPAAAQPVTGPEALPFDVAFMRGALELAPRAIALVQENVLHAGWRLPFWREHRVTRLAWLLPRPRFRARRVGSRATDKGAQKDWIAIEVIRRDTIGYGVQVRYAGQPVFEHWYRDEAGVWRTL